MVPFHLFFKIQNKTLKPLFLQTDFVWDPIFHLDTYLHQCKLGKIECAVPSGTTLVDPHLISIGRGSYIEAGAYIKGPTLIGRECHIRNGAYIRSSVLTGDGCVIGHSTEIKHFILLDGASAPHFNYVGDSILGEKVNLGAGAVCANMRLDKRSIEVRIGTVSYPTGLSKMGAIIGDRSQIGSNTVLNPGVMLGPGTLISPCSSVLTSNIKREDLHAAQTERE